ncbi:acetate/propionate family kinase [Rhodopila sp.]|uniref:acetate/propionate family kinase n=1 Tax=Rhodopila sp. TaxID=2480087 RepID=UPI003D0BE829
MKGSILSLNAGSSSIKFALFDAGDNLRPTLRGEIENLNSEPHMVARNAAGSLLVEKRLPTESALVLHTLLDFTDAHLGDQGLAAVGHRVVHGGADHIAPELITPALMTALEALTPLDPLHMPDNLAPIRAVASVRPSLRQVACFDTAFHHTMPAVATRFALPRSICAGGVRRYGFHGLSYEYIAGRLASQSPGLACGRVIVAHLGSGASLCALRDGASIDTTTGFSALDGLVMATRCGLLDPGVILYLGRQGHSFSDIEDILYRHSGLLGVSGLSGDVRVLLASADPHAREAIDLFTYRIACECGALISALGGLDGLVFTAGIGEHAPAIREAVCVRLGWLGLRLDNAANAASEDRISAPDSSVEVRVIATNEEMMVARHTQAAISRSVT